MHVVHCTNRNSSLQDLFTMILPTTACYYIRFLDTAQKKRVCCLSELVISRNTKHLTKTGMSSSSKNCDTKNYIHKTATIYLPHVKIVKQLYKKRGFSTFQSDTYVTKFAINKCSNLIKQLLIFNTLYYSLVYCSVTVFGD